MIQASMARRVLGVAGMAVGGAQAGHLLAYQLRFGPAAIQVQSSGAHAYFPTLVKTALGVAMLVALAALVLVAAAALLARGRAQRVAAPSYLNLLAALFTLQLTCFAGQEVIEALAAGLAPAAPSDLLLWGMVGQLPVALVAATALRWLWTRVEAAAIAIAAVGRGVAPVALTAARLNAFCEPGLALVHASRSLHVKRGPPVVSSIAVC